MYLCNVCLGFDVRKDIEKIMCWKDIGVYARNLFATPSPTTNMIGGWGEEISRWKRNFHFDIYIRFSYELQIHEENDYNLDLGLSIISY